MVAEMMSKMGRGSAATALLGAATVAVIASLSASGLSMLAGMVTVGAVMAVGLALTVASMSDYDMGNLAFAGLL